MTSAAYGLELQARALCPLYHPSNTAQDCHRFLVGTSSYSVENKIHLLEYHNETKTLECASVWSHKEEILGMWCSPSLSEKTLLATACPGSLRILQIGDNLMGGPKEVGRVNRQVDQVLWDLEGLQNEIRAVCGKAISTISLGGSKLGTETASHAASCDRIQHAVLDPHHASICLLACGTDGLQMVDYRQKRVTVVDDTRCLHGFDGVAGTDFSPTKPNEILTYGTDGIVLLHDLRMTSKTYNLAPITSVKAHEHAVHRALFNPFHDELILTGSADQSMKLWEVNKNQRAHCLRRLADFGDSVDEICWSSNGPWVFAGLSFHGKVLVDNVPSEKKMSILLEEQK